MRSSRNQARQRVASKLIRLCDSLDGTPEQKGRRLIDAFCNIPRHGDPLDLRSNGVDILTDVAHYAGGRGIAVQAILDAMEEPGRAGQELAGIASVYVAIKSVLEAEGHDFDRAMWAVDSHYDAERRTAPAPGM